MATQERNSNIKAYEGDMFIGIVEHIRPKEPSSYDYVIRDNNSRGLSGSKSLITLGELIAAEFGSDYRENITYKVPEIIQQSPGLFPKRFSSLSPMEKETFEIAVMKRINEDKGNKENSNDR